MSVRELQDRHRFNIKLLSSPYALSFLSTIALSMTRSLTLFLSDLHGRQASTSTYAQRVLAEQAEIEARLIEVDGMESINTGMKQTSIRDEDDMVVDTPPPPPVSRTLEAKRKALARFVSIVNP
jgi:hypothetical protein